MQRITVLRLVLLAAAERQETQVELLAAVALVGRHPVPADVEAQRLRLGRVPARGQPLPEARHQVVGNVGQGRAAQQGAQVRRHLHLARVRAQRMHFRRECTQAPGEGVDGHRRGQVGGVQHHLQPVQGQHAHGQHLRGTVVQRQAFLVGQRHRRQAGPAQCLGAGQALAGEERLATAEQDDGQVRQWRQIARGTDRTQRRHHRHHAGVEHRGERLQGFNADARMALEQGVDADAQHRPHHLGGHRLAHAHRVGDDQVVLQLLVQRTPGRRGAGQLVAQRMGAKQLVGIGAEAGGHPVDRLLAAHLLGQEVGGALHGPQRLHIQFDRCAMGDRNQACAGQ